MKKRIALLLAALLAVGSLTACSGDTNNSGDSENGGNGGDAAGTSSEVTVGLGSCTSFSESYSIGEDHYGAPAEATNAQADIHVATVMLDSDGKIIQCVIDAIQVKASVDGTGTMTTDPATAFQTKKELGTAYNMKPSSPIGKEWDEQIDIYEQWCIGKTAEQVAAGVGADEYPSDETLLTGCTIKTGDITVAVVDACENATATGASADDTLGLGMTGELSSYAAPSTNEAGEAVDGKVQAYVNYAATTQNANGQITCVLIDSIQATSTWGADGVLTTDKEADVLTKYEKQYDYGMVPASGIGKEWFEQIDVFKQFITNKTADEVTAIAVDESGYPTDSTLLTGCTMKVAAYKTAVVKSLAK